MPDALLSLVLSPTGDRQFGIALMPAACPIGTRAASFVDWQMTLHVVISLADAKILAPMLRTFTDDEMFSKYCPQNGNQIQNNQNPTFNRKISYLIATFP